MNKRFFLALILTAVVIVATPWLFPRTMRPTDTQVQADSTAGAVVPPSGGSTDRTVVVQTPTVPTAEQVVHPAINSLIVDTTAIQTPRSVYVLTSQGGAPSSVQLREYLSRRPGVASQKVELVASHTALTHYRLAIGTDTIALDTISLQTKRASSVVMPTVQYSGVAAGHDIRIEYTFQTDTAESYLVHVALSVSGAPVGSAVLVDLPRTLPANGPDTADDLNHLAVSYRPTRGEVNSIAFAKLDSAEVVTEPGPINWLAVRNKYFLVAFKTVKTPFASVRLQGASRQGKIATHATMRAALPLGADGSATFDIYAGPQDFQRLQHLGGDLDQVNPYAGWLHPVVQPFATMVMKALLWMKHTTHLNYGWVLVLFGIIIRLVLWPLNQSAMRTSMKMQRLQPELQALQKRHSDDPKKQQEAIMKVYKDHGMSPLSPLMGCLPMLLPMPVLFALYYVFQNTIEFRGVPFFWLPDISLHDPLYITPLLMGISMFVMSWIGMRNAPPNPQAKMMSYMMPVMFTVLFLNFASGLNLYYAVQNIAALPQQWLLARERGKPVALASSGSLDKRQT